MTEREKIVEVMAVALAEQVGGLISPTGIKAVSEVALTALEASGMAVVPVKASETMELAGYVCLDRTNPYGLDVVKNIWAAMLSAASPTPSMTENADE